MLLRDLIARITFQTNTAPLKSMGEEVVSLKRGLAGIAATALSGWALRSGRDVEVLKQQFKELTGGGLNPLQQTIDTLASEQGGMASIFRETDLLRGGVALKRAGFETQAAADILKLASLVAVRAGGDIGEALEGLSSGTMEGGLTRTLRGLNLITREQEFALETLERQISAGSGVVSEIATRQFRESLLAIIQQKAPELQAQYDEMLKSPAAAAMRATEQAGNMWDGVASGIVRSMTPALNAAADLMAAGRDLLTVFNEAGGGVEGFLALVERGFPQAKEHIDTARKVLQSFREYVAELWGDGLVEGATVGGLLMAALTGKASWVLGGAGAGLLLSAFKEEWEAAKKFLDTDLTGVVLGGSIGGLIAAVLTRNPALALLGAGAGAKGGQAIEQAIEEWLEGTDPHAPTELRIVQKLFGSGRDSRASTPTPLRVPEIAPPSPSPNREGRQSLSNPLEKEGTSFNLHGDIHIHTQASDPEAVAVVVRRELGATARRIILDNAPTLRPVG